jgi:hypothetical protein
MLTKTEPRTPNNPLPDILCFAGVARVIICCFAPLPNPMPIVMLWVEISLSYTREKGSMVK